VSIEEHAKQLQFSEKIDLFFFGKITSKEYNLFFSRAMT
jgi:hypothetical protein